MSRITVVMLTGLAVCYFACPLQAQAGVHLDQCPGIISRDPLPDTRFINNEPLNVGLMGDMASYPIRIGEIDAQATFAEDVCVAIHWASNGETLLSDQHLSALQQFASQGVKEGEVRNRLLCRASLTRRVTIVTINGIFKQSLILQRPFLKTASFFDDADGHPVSRITWISSIAPPKGRCSTKVLPRILIMISDSAVHSAPLLRGLEVRRP